MKTLDLSLNEGPLPPKEALRALREAGPDLLRAYANPAPLEKAYAKRLGVLPAQVLATTGGDDAIDRIARRYAGPGKELLHLAPTFVMVPLYAGMAGGRARGLEYPWGTLPADRIVQAIGPRTGVVAVLSPDNPTGWAHPASELLELAARIPKNVVFLVDQAYVEFAESDPALALLAFPNVVLVRTLSKAWGLAGLRVGFAVGSVSAISELRSTGGVFPMSGPGVRVAMETLQSGSDRMLRSVRAIRARRGRVEELMQGAGARTHPSSANFVLGDFEVGSRSEETRPSPGSGSKWVQRGLAAQGIKVRGFPDLPGALRITAPRDDDEMRQLELAFALLKRPPAILFDMDGVLADVRDSYRATILSTVRSMGGRATMRELEAAKAAGGANDDWILSRSLLAASGVEAPLEEVVRRFEEIYQGTPEQAGLRRKERLIPDPRLLEDLAGRGRLGVVTGRPRADAERFLREQGIEDWFSVVVCREDAPLKPHPGPVRRALAELGVDGGWMLGDNPDDIVSALGARVVPIGVVPPGGGETIRGALNDAGAAAVVDAGPRMGGLFS